MKQWLAPSTALPTDVAHATLVGRAWVPSAGGPVLVGVRDGTVLDLSGLAATSSQLLALDDPAAAVRAAHDVPVVGNVADLLANSDAAAQDASRPWLLAPCDLQAVKASGVTFVASLMERVIEEQARGDASKAAALRASITAVIGDNLQAIRPGSAEAAQVKAILIGQGVWSQYLEVGIGPDAEIFTKGQPMSSVGTGADVGIHPKSAWNNPEPEVVLAIAPSGRIVGATLGNDVNLRDFEGRSALLLGKAKDNNASGAIGPFIRLFDDGFGLDQVRACDLALHIEGSDGFAFVGESSMSKISRDPEEITGHAAGRYHQYPDGMMLYLGTMFAPTVDRDSPGQGFTHHVGDVVAVTTPLLGTLVNTVRYCDEVPPWTFGTTALMTNLAKRGLL